MLVQTLLFFLNLSSFLYSLQDRTQLWMIVDAKKVKKNALFQRKEKKVTLQVVAHTRRFMYKCAAIM